jgi:hypothetical protein
VLRISSQGSVKNGADGRCGGSDPRCSHGGQERHQDARDLIDRDPPVEDLIHVPPIGSQLIASPCRHQPGQADQGAGSHIETQDPAAVLGQAQRGLEDSPIVPGRTGQPCFARPARSPGRSSAGVSEFINTDHAQRESSSLSSSP